MSADANNLEAPEPEPTVVADLLAIAYQAKRNLTLSRLPNPLNS